MSVSFRIREYGARDYCFWMSLCGCGSYEDHRGFICHMQFRRKRKTGEFRTELVQSRTTEHSASTHKTRLAACVFG